MNSLLITALWVGIAATGQTGDDVPPPPQPEGIEVLTRGPVHEAFAEPVVFDPRPGLVIPRRPPASIEETPPNQRPEGRDVAWIGGYWAWDDEREDFLWVSGIWREIPPGRQWVPGYWNSVGSGSQWVNGYWANAQRDSPEYLPQPPATLEAGPNTPAPSANHAWAPGCWSWGRGRYRWRPGCWFVVRPDWVWIPAHYICTPGGYLFVGGYWDYTVARRGLLFAPVYLPPVAIMRPAFVYTPTVVIQETVLVDHLWCRPRYGFYYFGDYYAPSYSSGGFNFWLSFGSSRVGYDPIYVHQSHIRRRVDVAWETRSRQVYQDRVLNVSARPPRTFAAQREWLASHHPTGHDPRIAAPLSEVARARADMVQARSTALAVRSTAAIQARGAVEQARLEQLGETRRAEIASRSQRLRDLQQARQQREALHTARSVPARSFGQRSERDSGRGPRPEVAPRTPRSPAHSEAGRSPSPVRPPVVATAPKGRRPVERPRPQPRPADEITPHPAASRPTQSIPRAPRPAPSIENPSGAGHRSNSNLRESGPSRPRTRSMPSRVKPRSNRETDTSRATASPRRRPGSDRN